MNDNIDLYKSIATRERESRAEAERLLEQKSRELYKKNIELEETAGELSSANSLLSKIMRVAPDGILLCSEEFAILDVNATCEKKLECERSTLIGSSIEEFFPSITTNLKGLVKGEFFIDQMDAVLPSGEALSVELRGHVGFISDNAKYLLFFHDITKRLLAQDQRKRVEKQVDEARRLEAIGALSAGIAHEINTPIQFIGDNLDYLKDALQTIYETYALYDKLKEAAGTSSYQDHIQAIDDHNRAIKLAELIAEITSALTESREGIRQVRDIVLLMKEFAHPGSGAKEETDINKIVRSVASLCRNRQKNIADLEFDLASDLPLVICRRGQIQQVILNIVLNALDAVDEVCEKDGCVKIATRCENDHVVIAISDTGSGVPTSLKEKIFDPFFTTKPVGKGTGQGLALAKDCIVKGHSGSLCLADVPGFATTFLIELPIKPELISLNLEYPHVTAAE